MGVVEQRLRVVVEVESRRLSVRQAAVKTGARYRITVARRRKISKLVALRPRHAATQPRRQRSSTQGSAAQLNASAAKLKRSAAQRNATQRNATSFERGF